MKVTHDDSAYEARELRIMKEIVSSVASDLTKAGLSGAALYQATLRISFSVAEIMDGCVLLDFDDDHLAPVLAFAEGRMRDKLLAPKCGGGSMHEFTHGIVKELLGAPPKS